MSVSPDSNLSPISAAPLSGIAGMTLAGVVSKQINQLGVAATMRSTLKAFDVTAITRSALPAIDLTTFVHDALRTPNLAATLAVDPKIFGAEALGRVALESLSSFGDFSPSAALADTFKSLDFGAQLRTMSFGSGVDLLGILHGLQLDDPTLHDVDEPDATIDEDFDRAVRTITTGAANKLGTAVHLPEGPIAYAPWGDVDLQPDPEYREFVAQAAADIGQAQQPIEAIRRAVINTSFVIIILAMGQQAAPAVLEHTPEALSQPLEEHWPEWAHLPGWLTDAVLLGYALREANRGRRSQLE